MMQCDLLNYRAAPNRVAVVRSDRERFARYTANLLGRLREGPATAFELNSCPELYGLNYRARISDARAKGHRIVCMRGGVGGVNTYRLVVE